MEREVPSWNNSFVQFIAPKELIPIFKTSENVVKNTTLFPVGGHIDDWKRMREEREAEKGARYAHF